MVVAGRDRTTTPTTTSSSIEPSSHSQTRLKIFQRCKQVRSQSGSGPSPISTHNLWKQTTVAQAEDVAHKCKIRILHVKQIMSQIKGSKIRKILNFSQRLINTKLRSIETLALQDPPQVHRRAHHPSPKSTHKKVKLNQVTNLSHERIGSPAVVSTTTTVSTCMLTAHSLIPMATFLTNRATMSLAATTIRITFIARRSHKHSPVNEKTMHSSSTKIMQASRNI